MRFSGIIISIFLFLSVHSGFGQNPNQKRIGATGYVGRIIAHAADIENTAGAIPADIEFEFSKLLTDSATRDICNCFPTVGFRLAYTDYNNEVLGRGGHAGFFLHYNILPTKKLNPYLGGMVGLAYLSNPYDEVTNPENQSYSLHLNPYLRAAAGLEWKATARSILKAEIGFHHVSSGGLSQPNRGINRPALGLGYLFTPDRQDEVLTKIKKEKSKDKRGKTTVRAFVGATGNAVDYGTKTRRAVFGAGFITGLNLNNLNRITAGLEWHYDGGHAARTEYLELPRTSNRAALITGHEFMLGRFVFSQQIGVYIYDRARHHDFFYHRWGLDYKNKHGVFIGGSLKAHRHVAEFTEVRIGKYFK